MSQRTTAVPQLIFKVLTWLASPTRGIADFIKTRQRDRGKKFIWYWHWAFFLFAIVLCVFIYLLPGLFTTHLLGFCCCLLALWRCNEIFIAFLKDALDHLKGLPSQTEFSSVERIELAVRSYVEAEVDFGILYFFLPSQWFSQPFRSIIHAIYFSGVTLTTV